MLYFSTNFIYDIIILEKLEGYIERQNSLIAYDNEKFYKNGFCDGIKIILEALKNEKQDLIKNMIKNLQV